MDKKVIEQKFIRLVQDNERLIYKVCSFYASDEVPIHDLYQDVVLNLWASYPKFRGESSLSTWMYRIALNTCITGVRKEMRRPKGSVPLTALEESLSNPATLTAEIRQLYTLINQLRSVEKAIVLLYLEEKSYQEIADITGLTLSNVATKLKRAKEKMKQMSKL